MKWDHINYFVELRFLSIFLFWALGDVSGSRSKFLGVLRTFNNHLNVLLIPRLEMIKVIFIFWCRKQMTRILSNANLNRFCYILFLLFFFYNFNINVDVHMLYIFH